MEEVSPESLDGVHDPQGLSSRLKKPEVWMGLHPVTLRIAPQAKGEASVMILTCRGVVGGVQRDPFHLNMLLKSHLRFLMDVPEKNTLAW